MSGSAGQIEPTYVRTTIDGLECTSQPTVTGQPVNCTVQHMISPVDVRGGQMLLEDNTVLQTAQFRGARQLVQNDLPS